MLVARSPARAPSSLAWVELGREAGHRGDYCCARMAVYGQTVGHQRVDKIVSAWYPTHKAFRDLYLAPGAEENVRLKGLCDQHHVIHGCPGDCFLLYKHAQSDE